MSTDIRKLTKAGTQFYPQTHIEAIVGYGENGKAVDDVPIVGSSNLVESGGVSKALENSTRVTGNGRQTFEYLLEVGKAYTFVNHGGTTSVNVGNSNEYDVNTFETIATLTNEQSFTYTPVVEYTYISLYSGSDINKDIFIYPQDSIVANVKKVDEIDVAKIEAGIPIEIKGNSNSFRRARVILPLINGTYTLTNLGTKECSFSSFDENGDDITYYGNVRSGETLSFKINDVVSEKTIIGGFCDGGYHAVLRKMTSSINSALFFAPYGKNLMDILKLKGNLFYIVNDGTGNYAKKCQENDFLSLPYDCVIDSGSNYNTPYFYDPSTMEIDQHKPIVTNHVSFIPRNTVFRFLIEGADPEETYSLDGLINGTTIYRYIPSNEKIVNGVFNPLIFEMGSINTGVNSDYDNKCRIRNIKIESFDTDLTLKSHNYKFYLEYYDAAGNYIEETGWETSLSVEAGTRFRLVIANINRDYTPFEDLLTDVLVTVNDTLSESEVPVYYKSYLVDRTKTLLDDAILKKDGNGDNFFFITDTHFQDEGNNAGQSGKLIDYLAGRISMRKIIHGGDTGIAYKTTGKTGTEYIMKSIGWCTEKLYQYVQKYGFLNVHGNHDYNNFYEEGGSYVFKGLPIPNIRNFILGTNTLPYTTNNVDENGMYYYYDSPLSKIRYIIVDSEYNSEKGWMRLGSYQLPWIHNAVTNMQSGYDIVFVVHCPIEETVDTANERTPFADLLTYIRAINNHRSGSVGSINYNFTNTDYKVIMVIAGHTHADIETYIDNVLHVSTKCDKMDTSYPVESPFDEWAERKSGTVNEQAFDAVTIYNNHKDVQFRRIGDGTDRLFHTEKIVLSVNGTIDLSSEIGLIAERWVTNDSKGNTWTSQDGWSLSNTILSVTESGVVTALTVGDAFVFAEAEDGSKEFFYIEVI